MFSEVFGPVRTCLEPYGPVRTCPDAFGCLSEAFGHVLKNSKNLDFWQRFCLFSRILELRGVFLLTFFGFLRAQGCTFLGVYYWEPALWGPMEPCEFNGALWGHMKPYEALRSPMKRYWAVQKNILTKCFFLTGCVLFRLLD